MKYKAIIRSALTQYPRGINEEMSEHENFKDIKEIKKNKALFGGLYVNF